MRRLHCARSRVRSAVTSHPYFNLSPYSEALIALNTLKRSINGGGKGGGKGGGGLDKMSAPHRRPQVYQLLLSRVIDVKYGCFTFTFYLIGFELLVFYSQNIRELKQQRRRRLRKRHLKSEFASPQTLSRLFHLL